MTELPVVAALRKLSIFGPDQSGAYREHFAEIAEVLGDDVSTRLVRRVEGWARRGEPGVFVLTGNAGTGKTAAAQAFAKSVGSDLPDTDELHELAPKRWVVKDFSGIDEAQLRQETLREARAIAARGGQTLVCANEGILRDALYSSGGGLAEPELLEVLEHALREGAAIAGNITVVNVNRQRPTSAGIWQQLLDYVSREELWTGCDGCPFVDGGCSMRANAARLRDPSVREQLRTLVRLGAGEAVPTMREVLAVLAYAIVGDDSCDAVVRGFRDLGLDEETAASGYFSRAVGGGLAQEALERSQLLVGMRLAGLGRISDLEVDAWLRDTSGAPTRVQDLAGDPARRADAEGLPVRPGLRGSRSPLDRVRTKQNVMTFHALGEMVSTDEKVERVEDGLDALVRGDASNPPALELWRQQLFFEAADDLGGAAAASRRLLSFRYLPDLVALASKVSEGGDTVLETATLVRGLNFLVTGYSSSDDGLVVPDAACLFARDPGSFRHARPSLVHSLVETERLQLAVPDVGLVRDVLDVDDVEVDLVVGEDLRLRIRPRMYEAIREAAEFRGPVGQGVAEMTDLRGFYGRLAAATAGDSALRVANPDSKTPNLVKIRLPHFVGQEP